MKRLIWMGKGLTVTAALCAALVMNSPLLLADEGDIVIIRTVQPRNATRLPLTPDPRPMAINPRTLTDTQTQGQPKAIGSIVKRSLNGELNDNDFSTVSSGQGLNSAGRLLQVPTPSLGSTLPGTTNQAVNGSGVLPGASNAGGGAALANVPGQINRSLQQGLRPLHMLTGQ